MIYMKHERLGNEHFAPALQTAMEAAGWVRFPHGDDPWIATPVKAEVVEHEEDDPENPDAEPAKRRGRPPKV